MLVNLSSASKCSTYNEVGIPYLHFDEEKSTHYKYRASNVPFSNKAQSKDKAINSR